MDLFLNESISRRTVLQVGAAAAGALIVSCRHFAKPTSATKDGPVASGPGTLLAAYLEIGADGKIRFITTRAESGQGIGGGFAVLIAEELDVDPESIEIIFAGVNNRIPVLSKLEKRATGGSSSMRAFYLPVRQTAAAARDMLIAAAAGAWQVAPSECQVKEGSVVHPPSQRTATFASLAVPAALVPVPLNPVLKSAVNFKFIGKSNRRLEVTAKSTGAAIYGIDVKVEGMLAATVVHCPFVGGELQSVNDTVARQQPGVKDVIRTPYGVAVVADTYWHAVAAARRLVLQWSQTSTESSATILAKQKQLVESPGMVAANAGDFASAFAQASKKVEAVYQTQYLPHTTLEPQNCTAWVKADGTCEIWAPTQSPSGAASIAAAILGVDEAKIKVNLTLLGGGFGRRLRQDYVAEAVYVAKALPNQPVKILWTRSDEFSHDMFRPSSYSKMQAGIDTNGALVAWQHRIACSSIWAWLEEKPSNSIQPGQATEVDGSSVEGASKPGYQIPNFRCEWAQHEPGVPVFWWRSVGHSQNAFFVESFLDECAFAANVDPIAFRLNLLQNPRARAVLELVREKSGWATPPPAGIGRGVAIHECFGSVVAQVVEVSILTQTIFVHKVTVAIDCGTAVDAASVHTQMESSIAQALAAALKQEITINNGRVVQLSLNQCQPLLLSEMPQVSTYIVPSTEVPGGIGEPGVPPLAPAVANAVFALSGQRIRALPLKV